MNPPQVSALVVESIPDERLIAPKFTLFFPKDNHSFRYMLLGAKVSWEAAKANQFASSQADIRHKYLRFCGRNYSGLTIDGLYQWRGF